MDVAKSTIKEALKERKNVCPAALYFNPGKFLDIRDIKIGDKLRG